MNDQFIVKDSKVYDIEHLLNDSYCECGKLLIWQRYNKTRCTWRAECECGTNWNTIIKSIQVFKEYKPPCIIK